MIDDITLEVCVLVIDGRVVKENFVPLIFKDWAAAHNEARDLALRVGIEAEPKHATVRIQVH